MYQLNRSACVIFSESVGYVRLHNVHTETFSIMWIRYIANEVILLLTVLKRYFLITLISDTTEML